MPDTYWTPVESPAAAATWTVTWESVDGERFANVHVTGLSEPFTIPVDEPGLNPSEEFIILAIEEWLEDWYSEMAEEY